MGVIFRVRIARILIMGLIGAIFCFFSEANAVEYEGGKFRDPFGPAEKKDPTVKDEISDLGFTLEGLVWNTENPRAIVCGKAVRIGEVVKGATVLSIERNGVKLRYKNQEFNLRLHNG